MKVFGLPDVDYLLGFIVVFVNAWKLWDKFEKTVIDAYHGCSIKSFVKRRGESIVMLTAINYYLCIVIILGIR